jgi:threonine synthase
MKYVSTRGSAPVLGFADVVLAGLANDGGLYVPETWPTLGAVTTGSYAELAASVFVPYVGADIDNATMQRLCDTAYSTFRHPDVVPIVPLESGHHLMELFHGPTLAFKDVALQLLGQLFDHILTQRNEKVTIVGATSGDTGSAAIDGVKNCANINIIILYPHGRVSDVQRKQMTTVDSPNVRTVAIDGTFDDCQDLVKAMFNDAPFREKHNLSAVNSINWARVMAQVVYYFEATRKMGGPIDVTVPTGNFGNVLSGWIAKQMGAPIRRLIVASNENDILTRFFDSQSMAITGVHPTLSPSMDIQVSSNFERLLFEMNDRDGAVTAEQLTRFRDKGLSVEPDQYEQWIAPTFRASRATDHDTLATIRSVYEDFDMLIDPHTAVGVKVAREFAEDGVPMLTMATAHPAKFPDAVERATGVRPGLPEHLSNLFDLPEFTVQLPNDLATVEAFVAAQAK